MRFSLVKFSNTKYISKYIRSGVIPIARSNTSTNTNTSTSTNTNTSTNTSTNTITNTNTNFNIYKSLSNFENESFKNENESLKNKYIILKFKDYEEIVNKNYNMI